MMETKLARISQLSKQNPNMVFTSIGHLINEEMLKECYPDGIGETELNDIFWFEEDMIAEWLGYNNFDEIMERGSK